MLSMQITEEGALSQLQDHQIFETLMETAKNGAKQLVENGHTLIPVIFTYENGCFFINDISIYMNMDVVGKNIVASILDKMREEGVPYCMVTEAYTSTVKPEDANDCVPPSKDPNRKECIFIQGNFLGEDVSVMAELSIEREVGEWKCSSSQKGRFCKEKLEG